MLLRLAVAVLLLVSAGSVIAGSDDCVDLETDCIRTGEWEFELHLGAGVRTNPIESADNLPLFIIPQWRYYGERWFIDNLEIGYSILNERSVGLALIATPNDDRMYFHRWDPGNVVVDLQATDGAGDGVQTGGGSGGGTGGGTGGETANSSRLDIDGLRERRYALHAGFEFSLHGDWGALVGQMLWDVTDVHDGREVRIAYSKPLQAGVWAINPSAGWTWKSEQLVDYYYGVRPEETTESRGLYVGEAALNPFVKLAVGRELGDDWRWITSVSWVRLGKGIHASPIVEEEDVTTVFAGVSYRF